MPCPRCGAPVEQTFCMVADENNRDLCRACKPGWLAESIADCE
jgi:hypothetical protein